MQKTSSFLVAFLVILFSACAASNKPSSGGKKGGGDAKSKKEKAEDLSAYRPKFDVADTMAAAPVIASIIPVAHVNDQVKTLMDTVAANNKNIKYAQGFRILAYTGNDRSKAMDIRRAIINRFPDERDYLTYKQPTYRLRIGDFLSRVEANQVLQELKDVIPNALIVPEQVNIVRSTED